jgi:hypothetical protein
MHLGLLALDRGCHLERTFVRVGGKVFVFGNQQKTGPIIVLSQMVNAQQQLRVASRQQTAPLDITKLTSKYRTLGYINDGIVLCEHLATGRQVVVKQTQRVSYV